MRTAILSNFTRSAIPGGLAIMLCGYAVAQSPTAQIYPQVSAMPVSSASVLYNWQSEHCETWDVPDAPLRAFRDSHNQVVAFVSDAKSRVFAGPDLTTIKHSCHSAFVSKADADPTDFNDLRYITATWTDDGVNVISLTHTEFHAEMFPGRCSQTQSIACWFNVVIAMKSTDGGNNFSAAQKVTLIAAPNFTQDVEQGRHRGFFNPSNIVANGGYWYTLISTTGQGAQKAGTCLFRASNINDVTSWRAYDGSGFTSRAINPYDPHGQTYIPCQPLPLHGIAGSLSYFQSGNAFLAVFQTGSEAKYPNGRIAYQWSHDLIHWSPDTTLLDVPTMGGGSNCSVGERYGYPSIADPASPSRNFDSILSAPLLFMTRFHTGNCELLPNRDLIAVQLNIS